MGGIGSGRYAGFGARSTTDAMRSLDVRRSKRDGLLSAGSAFQWRWHRDGEVVGSVDVSVDSDAMRLRYKTRGHGEDWQAMNYRVLLDRTFCHYGGTRDWFICPAVGCGRRVAKLYGGKVFACRHCHQLTYSSQNEGPMERAARRAEKHRRALGWKWGETYGEYARPRGMHRKTFQRHLKAILDADYEVSTQMTKFADAMKYRYSLKS